MIYCFDTFYKNNTAKTACIGISSWQNENPDFEMEEVISDIEDYESGSFYKRELPCILSILEKIDLNAKEDILVVDGFVLLDDDGKLGLGGHLFHALDKRFPVIGVAKNNFYTLDRMKSAVLRGDSKKPLYITALGLPLQEAHQSILGMHGDFRMPTILKLLDQNSRK